MVNAFIWLLLLCVAMLVSSFVAGCIPLATKLSESKLNFLTSLSVGLLISTSLVVIIPEGVETLYSNNEVQADLDHLTTTTITTSSFAVARHTAVGLSLLLGFSLMFIIDQVSSMHIHPSATITMTNTNVKNRQSLELDAILTVNVSNETAISTPLINSSTTTTTTTTNSTSSTNTTTEVQQQQQHRHLSVTTPTIGLIVHAAADGIALGASATYPQLSMVVFFAIMLHKAPSAFALTTVLLSEGLSRVRVRQHLLMFSISAPIGAISTYMLLQLFSNHDSSALQLEYWTGILLLFSGGTFLYVAMHAIQELQMNHADGGGKRVDWSQMGSIFIGMLIPFILNLNHSH